MNKIWFLGFMSIGLTCYLMAEPEHWDGSGFDGFWNAHRITVEQRELLKRQQLAPQRLSVIIPCYFKHAKQLAGLLHCYENQTRLPDEVIISLSEVHRIDPQLLEQLQNELWAFPVKIITSKEKKGPGTNRNSACSYAKGDIFMCQDADDIPHEQRVEIVHYFFSLYNIDHLMHGYKRIKPEQSFIPFEAVLDLSRLEFAHIKDFETVYAACLFQNGNAAISRRVFEAIKWRALLRGEDTEFNREVYKKFGTCIVLRAILHGYREFLSSAVKQDANQEDLILYQSQGMPEKKYRLEIVTLSK